MRILVFFVAFFALLMPISAQSDYVKEIEKWRAAHETELKAENGWLTVAGLFWLKEGANTIGAGAGFDIQLTENFKQEKFGEINFQNGKAFLKVAPNVEAFADDKIITEIELVSDEKGKPTIVQIGSQTFYLIKRGERLGIRLKDQNSKERVGFSGLKWFPVDEKYRIEATFEPFSTPKEVLIPNVLGGNFKMKSPGILRFRLKGKNYALEPVLEADDAKELFIIFRDATSKNETYGAGRFLYAKLPENGKVVLDFNKSENPPCAFTPFATCPLPPPQNRLVASIKAGEKRYADH